MRNIHPVRGGRRPSSGHIGITVTLFAVLSLASGCGPKAVQTRVAPIYPCVQQARTARVAAGPQKGEVAPILGWFSLASFDRWIAEIDRIGKRAGIFAPKSSYRDHALEVIRDGLAEMGMLRTDWWDTARPWHVFIQPQGPIAMGGEPIKGELRWIFGSSVVVPTRGRDMFTAALPREGVKTGNRPASLQVGRDGKIVHIDGLNFFTEVVTVHEDRYPTAAAAAMCMHDRAPKPLFKVGIAIADLYKAHGEAVGKLLEGALESLPNRRGKAQSLRSLRAMGKWMGKYLAESEVMTISGDVDERAMRLGLAFRAMPGTRTAKRTKMIGDAPPNPLIARLPATAWYASGDTFTALYDEEDYRAIIGIYTDALELDEATSTRLVGFIRQLVELLGDHGASAMFVEQRFPMAYVNIMDAKDPEKLVKTLGDGIYGLIDMVELMARREQSKLGKIRPDADQKIKEAIAKAREKTLGQWVDELVLQSKEWAVRFDYEELKQAGARCRVLKAQADMKKLLGNRIAMRVLGFTGDRLAAALCTTDKHIVTSFGPRAVERAMALLSDSAPALGKQPVYKAMLRDGKPPVAGMLLNIAPLLDLVGKMAPIPLQWPEGEAITFTCGVDDLAMDCDFAVPTAVIDLFRQVKAAMGAFGRGRR